ncbi:MAG: hypothetical protein U9P80_05740 [Thermodesulfobacteriota bacterium]|nr:hypothetical protein [Thermodesulfobacteriota bacterium]
MKEEKILEMIELYPEEGVLPCSVAHFIAEYLDVSPLDVGMAANHANVKLCLCQIGAFGYGRKGTSNYKIFKREVQVPEGVLDRIRQEAVDGRISCETLWDIARDEGVARPEVGNAADSLGMKITPCQLGAF